MIRINEDLTVTKLFYPPEVVGTHKQGDLNISFATLVAAFGVPRLYAQGENDKVDAEWIIYTPSGIATIYNYKNGENYEGEEGLPVEDIEEWSIGGHDSTVVSWIDLVIGKFRT